MAHAPQAPSAAEALARLKQGNRAYAQALHHHRLVDAELRELLAEQGQCPYAVVLACADSRVVPEHIFSAGLGELFTIRVAGNVAGPSQVASAVYAAEHLGTRLVVVLGHTGCGAVGAVLAGADDEALAPVVEPIGQAVQQAGAQHDERAATCANVAAAVQRLQAEPALAQLAATEGLLVAGALYNTASGEVEWL